MTEFIKKCTNMPISELNDVILKAEYNYIYEDAELFTDKEYDTMLEIYSSRTGTRRSSNVTINKDIIMTQLPCWMHSLDKAIHGDPTLTRWLKKHTGSYVISSKMDGMSVLYQITKEGQHLYTRGTYEMGQDITMILQYLNLPIIPEGICIRGELIMPESIFLAKYSTIYKNGRAAIAGVCRTFNIANYKEDKVNKEFAKDVKFVTYEIISLEQEYQEKPSKQYKILKHMGFEIIKWTKLDIITDAILSDHYDKWKTELDYAIDGLVIGHNVAHKRATEAKPDYAIAYKKELDELIGFSEVLMVKWKISKCGYLKPVIYIKPITINTILIKKTTGINARYIVNNGIGPGAQVKIIRSGDVIPNIAEVITAVEPSLPENIDYVWNSTNVDIMINDDDNEEMQLSKIKFFLKSLNVKFIDEKTIKKIYDTGITTIAQLCKLKKSDLAFLGDVMPKKIMTSLTTAINSASISMFMTASGIFGRGLGIKKLTAILNKYPDIITREYNNDELKRMLGSISGFANKTIDKFILGFREFKMFYSDIKKTDNIIYKEHNIRKITATASLLKNKKICITGFRDETIADLITSSGGTIQSSINKSTDILIIKDISYSNKKTETATELGITILTCEEFKKQYDT